MLLPWCFYEVMICLWITMIEELTLSLTHSGSWICQHNGGWNCFWKGVHINPTNQDLDINKKLKWLLKKKSTTNTAKHFFFLSYGLEQGPQAMACGPALTPDFVQPWPLVFTFHIVCGRFCTTAAELGSCNRAAMACKASNICNTAVSRKSLPNPGCEYFCQYN